jgi:serine/threonine protein kinase
MEEPPYDNSPDSMLVGRYALQTLCGRGGMGTVYRAFDTQLNRIVAAKCVHGECRSEDADAIRREGKILASFSHKNVVQVYDVIPHQNSIWLISEYLEGLSLDKITTPMGITPCIAVMTQLYEALGALHRRQIFHRDLKPSNLFLTRNGAIKLIDFGVAFHPQESSGKTMAGTLQYCDPRILAGEMPKYSSDMYSAALVMIELLTGQKVWPELAPLPIYRLMTRSMDTRIGELTQGMFPLLADLVRRSVMEVAKTKGSGKPPLTAEEAERALTNILKELGPQTAEEILTEALAKADFGDAAFRMLLSNLTIRKSKEKTLNAKERSAWMSFGNGTSDTLRKRQKLPGFVVNRKWTFALAASALAATAGMFLAAKLSHEDLSVTMERPADTTNSPKIEAPREGNIPKVIREVREKDIAATAVTSLKTPVVRGKILEILNPDAVNRPKKADAAPRTKSEAIAQTSKVVRTELTAPLDADAALYKSKGIERPIIQTVAVTIVADGWADVFIDGKSAGRIPRAKPFVLAPGFHQFRLVSPFLEKKDEKIEIPPVGNFRLSFRTIKKNHPVTFKLAPQGELTVDEENFGLSSEKTVLLSIGKHRIRINRIGKSSETRIITVSPNFPGVVYL